MYYGIIIYKVFNKKEKYGNLYMDNCKIFLVRHGQSLGNVSLTFLGHTDLDLSELGYAQADLTAEFLSNIHFDAIYSSDLIRAYNTALPNAKMRGMEVIARTDLREVFVGEWENMNCTDIEQMYGDLYRIGWHKEYGTFTFPGGESTIGAGKRFSDAVRSIAQENYGKNILIAAHGAVIRSFWASISGISPEEIADALPFATNASVSILEFDGENFIPIKYSQDEHLSSIGITSVKF